MLRFGFVGVLKTWFRLLSQHVYCVSRPMIIPFRTSIYAVYHTVFDIEKSAIFLKTIEKVAALIGHLFGNK